MKFNEYLNNNITTTVQVNVNESSLSRVWGQVTKFQSGTISAYRDRSDCGEGELITKKEKERRNTILKSKLLMLGYGVTKIMGTYIENYKSDNEVKVKEASFIVVDINDKGNLKRDLMKLGLEFEQDSITFSEPSGEYYLISTNKCPNAYPGNGRIGKEVKLGKSMFGKKGIFYSTINGRPLVFESIENILDTLTSKGPTQIRSVKHFSEESVL